MKIMSFFLLLALAFQAGPALAGPSRLHVDLDGREGGSVHLTLSVERTRSLFREALSKADLKSDVDAASAAKLRSAWAEVKRSGGEEGVTLQDDEERVTLSDREGQAVIEITHPERPREKVRVRVPEEAMEALLSGAEDTLDFDAALRALKARGRGEVIGVEGSDGGRLKVWLQ